ncbi:MAG: aldehyde dehydrogenase family protein, partial [Candidatus Aminicenantes bacterium]|nr:aldehyde dehydrogenase family protein [Candidatus Aminicenantes bacterium]
MRFESVLINGDWRPAKSVGSFQAYDPSTGDPLPDAYPVSSWEDALEALTAGRAAALELAAASPDVLADFLDLFARRVVERADDLAALAHRETALPVEPRLRMNELPRTANQTHQAAAAARDRSWCRATIDTQLNIRSKYAPLGGPVVVFGPSNFPLAFNAAGGGDAVAAIAAGNPVIAKGHPGHPATTRLFAEIALDCLAEAGLPRATVQLVHHLRPEDGLRLVAHPWVGATAFTGSRAAGLKLKEAADRAGKPIYLEMSSVNPVFVLPGAM